MLLNSFRSVFLNSGKMMQQAKRSHDHEALSYRDVLGLIFYSYEYTLSSLTRRSCLPVCCPYLRIPILHQFRIVSELRLKALESVTKNHDFVRDVFTLGL